MAAGTKFEFANMHVFLNHFVMTDAPKADDIAGLASLQFPTVGTKCLGKLEAYIKVYSKNKESKDDQIVEFQARGAINYIEIYLRLSAFRQLLLLQYYCILKSGAAKMKYEATAEGVLGNLMTATKKVIHLLQIARCYCTARSKSRKCPTITLFVVRSFEIT